MHTHKHTGFGNYVLMNRKAGNSTSFIILLVFLFISITSINQKAMLRYCVHTVKYRFTARGFGKSALLKISLNYYSFHENYLFNFHIMINDNNISTRMSVLYSCRLDASQAFDRMYHKGCSLNLSVFHHARFIYYYGHT